MDITTDGFGFMLSVGDLAWVPFVYSLQARYLAFKPMELGPVWTAVVLLINLSGYYIFRDSNGEKNDFRNGKNPKSKLLYIYIMDLSDSICQILDTLKRPADRSFLLLAGGVVHGTRTTCKLVHKST